MASIKRKNRGVPVFVYFIVLMLFALLCVSLATGYLYTEFLSAEYMSDIMNKKFDDRSIFIFKSTLVFGGAWFVILAFLVLLGRRLQNSFKTLINDANQLGIGNLDVEIMTDGPREVRDLAFALERIRNRMKSGQ